MTKSASAHYGESQAPGKEFVQSENKLDPKITSLPAPVLSTLPHNFVLVGKGKAVHAAPFDPNAPHQDGTTRGLTAPLTLCNRQWTAFTPSLDDEPTCVTCLRQLSRLVIETPTPLPALVGVETEIRAVYDDGTPEGCSFTAAVVPSGDPSAVMDYARHALSNPNWFTVSINEIMPVGPNCDNPRHTEPSLAPATRRGLLHVANAVTSPDGSTTLVPSHLREVNVCGVCATAWTALWGTWPLATEDSETTTEFIGLDPAFASTPVEPPSLTETLRAPHSLPLDFPLADWELELLATPPAPPRKTRGPKFRRGGVVEIVSGPHLWCSGQQVALITNVGSRWLYVKHLGQNLKVLRTDVLPV